MTFYTFVSDEFKSNFYLLEDGYLGDTFVGRLPIPSANVWLFCFQVQQQ